MPRRFSRTKRLGRHSTFPYPNQDPYPYQNWYRQDFNTDALFHVPVSVTSSYLNLSCNSQHYDHL